MVTQRDLDRGRMILGILVLLVMAALAFSCGRPGMRPVYSHKARPAEGYTAADLVGWYDTYNRRYFQGKLPPARVRLGDLPGYYAWTERGDDGVFDIAMDRDANQDRLWARVNLLHEMAHVATAGEFEPHGPRWRYQMHVLMMEGAFDDLI